MGYDFEDEYDWDAHDRAFDEAFSLMRCHKCGDKVFRLDAATGICGRCSGEAPIVPKEETGDKE